MTWGYSHYTLKLLHYIQNSLTYILLIHKQYKYKSYYKKKHIEYEFTIYFNIVVPNILLLFYKFNLMSFELKL